MNLNAQPVHRLQCRQTGRWLHFTNLNETTSDEKEAWCGTVQMVKTVRERFPVAKKMKAVHLVKGSVR